MRSGPDAGASNCNHATDADFALYACFVVKVATTRPSHVSIIYLECYASVDQE